jgi:hypothetical protein
VNQKDDNIQFAEYLGNHTMLHVVEHPWKATNAEYPARPSKYLVRPLKPTAKPPLDSHEAGIISSCPWRK